MQKRLKGIALVLCFFISAMFIKCGYIMLKFYISDESVTNSYKIEVSETRGNIYDKNGEKLVNDKKQNTLIIRPGKEAVDLLKNNLTTEDFLEIQQKILNGRPAEITVDYKLPESNDIIQLETYKRYSDNGFLQHLLGYTDVYSKGVSGLEKAFENILTGKNRKITTEYTLSATGTSLFGEQVKIRKNEYYSPQGIKITIDKNIQTICEEAIDSYDVEKGAVVVLDAESFEILAMVSRPVFNPYDVGRSLKNEQSPLINRALSAYSTGSVFKIVVAAAALEEGVDFSYYCNGKTEINGLIFNCHKKEGHGEINLEDALSQSCNTYFINLAKKLSGEKILATASELGFGENTVLCEGIESDAGNLPAADELNSDAALANLSFGQGSLTSTPLQIAVMTATVANSGNFVHANLIEGYVDENSEITETVKEAPVRVLSESTCEFIRNAMVKATKEGTGKKANPINTSAGVKTSTAENSDGTYNSWLTGFLPEDRPEYVVVILKEDGVSGGEDCGPIFKKIAEKITLLSS